MTAGDIERVICKHWFDVMWLPQCRVGCGHGQDGERTMDLWGISVKRPYLHLAVEIKTTRSDFTRDLKSPLKQRRARLAANQFYYAAPKGMLSAADLPPWAGLLEIGPGSISPLHLSIAVPAPWFDSSPPTWSFVASLVRRLSRKVED